MDREIHASKFNIPNFGIFSGESKPATDQKVRRLAGILGLSYLGICTLYILVSGELALRVAQTPEQLAMIERVKGVVFIVVSSIVFYLIARVLENRIEAQDYALREQRRALLEAETRAAAGLMAASVAHDIRNVLTLFNFQLYRLNHHQVGQPVEQEAVVHQMGEAVDRLNGLATRLLALSYSDVTEALVVKDVSEVVKEDVEFIRVHQTLRGCKVICGELPPLEMPMRRGLIDQLMLNLLLNAAEAVGGQGTIEVKTYREGADAVIEVHDSGQGIRDQDSGALFEAFYTTKPSGHGLGLYTVKACTELHNGQVAVRKSHLGGACFTVRLPMDTVHQS